MPDERLNPTSEDVDRDISPLLMGLLIAFIPSALAWAGLIYSAIKLGTVFRH